MSVFPTPTVWANGAVTAAQMNQQSSGITWLKNAIDLLTGSTASDVGDGTSLSITRATIAGVGLQTRVTGEAGQRFRIFANGDQAWGAGAGTPDTLLMFENGGMKFVRPLSAPGGLRLGVKTTAYSAGDIDGSYSGPTSGILLGFDAVTRRLYALIGGTVRYVVFT